RAGSEHVVHRDHAGDLRQRADGDTFGERSAGRRDRDVQSGVGNGRRSVTAHGHDDDDRSDRHGDARHHRYLSIVDGALDVRELHCDASARRVLTRGDPDTADGRAGCEHDLQRGHSAHIRQRAVGESLGERSPQRRDGIYGRDGALINEGDLGQLTRFPVSELSDPQIVWDPTSQRFYYLAVDFYTSEFAFGYSKTADPRSDDEFCHYQVGAFYNSFYLPDYPKLAVTR